MDTNRSILDTLNAGRKRRPGTSLEHISRSLQEIEEQLDRAYDTAKTRIAPARDEQVSSPVPESQPAAASPHSLAPDVEQTRQQESDLGSLVTREVTTLRDEIRQMMDAGLHQEFETLRADLRHINDSLRSAPGTADIGAEMERLSDRVASLAESGNGKALQLLRLDIEQLRGAIDNVAREETVQSVGRRWEELAAHSTGTGQDRAFETLAARLEQIDAAVRRLPDALPLASLDDKVRTLAGALDQFIEHSSAARPDLHAMIDERLDEISRAIAAFAAAAKAPPFDPEPFERIEARIASLARQVEEVVEERETAQLAERIDHLARRVDEIAGRTDLPQELMEGLTAQIAALAGKLDQPTGPEAVFGEIDHRFAGISELIERQQSDTLDQSRQLFDDLKRQLGELAERMDRYQPGEGEGEMVAALDARFAELWERLEARRGGADEQVLSAVGTRLEKLTDRLEESFSLIAGMDPDAIRNLQSQIAGLAEHIARPGADLSDFDDFGPRLARIERSLAENREAVIEAARSATEETLSTLADSRLAQPDGTLAAELKELEALTRRSDDRNARTFEAIHDTLLKIVDRLGAYERGEQAEIERESVKLAVGTAPSIEPEAEGDLFEFDQIDDASPMQPDPEADAPEVEPRRRTPAEAAAEAAVAAMSGESEAQEAGTSGRRSVLGGLTRAFAGRKEREAAGVKRKEPTVEADEAEQIDPGHVNDPLEPGSGAPDLNAIMRRVRDEGNQHARPSEDDTAKSDFIAAARRAAQAAAAEAETLKRKKSAEARGSGGRFGVGSLLRSRRNSALLAVAAVALLAAGLGFGRHFLPDNGDPAKLALQQEPKQAVAAAPQTEQVEVAHLEPSSEKTAALPASSTDPEPRVIEAGADVDETSISSSDVEETPSADAEEAERTEVEAPSEPADAAAISESQPQAAVEAPSPAEPTKSASLQDIPATVGPLALREAAASGDPKALFAIADRYAQGNGVEADAAEAARWYEKAAEAGLAPAQYRVGNGYEKGIGVARDVGKAMKWYRLAAEAGNASAMHNLGVLYAMGAGGDVDNGAAAQWFLKAAERGVKDSQFNLGILSAKGVGVPKDLAEAYKWFALVADTGDADAAAKRDEIAKTLTPEALKQAKARKELWKAKPLDRDANVVNIPAAWSDGKPATAGAGNADVKKAVTNIQRILNKNGYSTGPIDGVMGDRTKSAIIAFQKDNGLDATGQVNKQLVEALLERK